MQLSFHGVFPAVITPFVKTLFDLRAAKRQLAFLAEADVSGVVMCGTTGEGLTLSDDERFELCTAARAAFPNKPVIMGIVTSHIQSALDQVTVAQQAGADALLVAAPYYVKADPAGLFDYFDAIHTHTTLPIVLYNNPGRLGFELSFSLLEKLTHLPRMVAIKESSPSLERVLMLKKIHNWSILGGDDTTWPAFLALGGDGLISVGANIAPKLYMDYWHAWQRQDLAATEALLPQLNALHALLGLYPNPKAINYASALKGWGDGSTRLPQSSLTQDEQDHFAEVLKEMGLVP